MVTSLSLAQGIDLPDIELVIQWKVTTDMCTLWQRFGRAARNAALRGKALLLAETKYFDAEIERALEKAVNKANQKKRKGGDDTADPQDTPLTKKVRRTPFAPGVSVPGVSAVTAAPVTADVENQLKEGKEMYDYLRLVYSQVPAEERRSQSSQKKKVLELVMQHFLNARTRPGVDCFRFPINIFFGNVGLSE